jgi:chitin disaccharide deacetylase
MKQYLIFNADDFGASAGVNRGILEAHLRGVVTSASLMVTGRALKEAVAMSRNHPRLAVGLHWDVCGEDERAFDLADRDAVRAELDAQLKRFQDVIGRMPTHVDSHRHAHREVMSVFEDVVAPLGIPIRGDGRITYLSGFYAQWEWQVTELQYVSVPFLQGLIRTEVLPGFSEIGCHPGYISDDYQAVYLTERETEIATLTDSRIQDTIRELDIELISFADYLRLEPLAHESAARV